MNFSEGILIIVVLILLYIATQRIGREGFTSCAASKPATESFARARTSGVPQFALAGLETAEPFENANNVSEHDYKDWVTSQAIDSEVIKNHKQYLAEQAGDSSIGTFRASKLRPIQEPYPDVPTMGLRPARAVPVGDPERVTEYYPGNYSTGPVRLA